MAMDENKRSNRVYRLAAIPGDGIGKEVLPEGLRVLEAAAKRFGFRIETDSFDFANVDYWLHVEVRARRQNMAGVTRNPLREPRVVYQWMTYCTPDVRSLIHQERVGRKCSMHCGSVYLV